MSKYLSGVAALGLLGAATFAMPATAAERQAGVTALQQSTEFSSQRRYRGNRVYARHWRGGPRYYGGPRRYVGPGPYAYYDDYPYGYYQPRPFVSFGVGPFGFWF
jgi:hypothetical protein